MKEASQKRYRYQEKEPDLPVPAFDPKPPNPVLCWLLLLLLLDPNPPLPNPNDMLREHNQASRDFVDIVVVELCRLSDGIKSIARRMFVIVILSLRK